jgi:hypothetical protein
MQAVGSTPTASPTASPTPTVGPTMTSSPCRGCINPLDAICWEGPARCIIIVVSAPAISTVVTARYRTVAMTARPRIDYVEITSGTLVLQAGQSSAEIAVELIPDPDLTQERTFGVELYDTSGAGLARPMATVTIRPARG